MNFSRSAQRFVWGTMLTAVLASATMADEMDPLHGQCLYSAPSCVDNGTITPIYTNGMPTFSFDRSPERDSATNFQLDVLIPNNLAGANSESITITGTNTGNSSESSTTPFNSTAWTSGDLIDYLGISGSMIHGSPPNPIDAWLNNQATQKVDPGATGYFVYQLNFGAVTFDGAHDPTFSSSLLPNGTIITAFADGHWCNSNGKNCQTGWVSTAQSGGLFLNAPPSPVPEPVTLSLFGVGLVGMGALRRRKAKRA